MGNWAIGWEIGQSWNSEREAHAVDGQAADAKRSWLHTTNRAGFHARVNPGAKPSRLCGGLAVFHVFQQA